MTADEFRKLALGFPGAIESSHMNHPDFRIAGRIFASLAYPDESWGMVGLNGEQQRDFVERGQGAFRPCNGAWGERGATNVHLPSANRNLVTSALAAAVDNVLAKAKTKRARRKRPS
jgi:hypothetical protein